MSELDSGATPVAAEATAIADVQTVESHADQMDAIAKTMSDAYDKINPQRDDGGRFKSDASAAEMDNAEGAESSDADKTEITDQTQKEEGAEPHKIAAIDAPISWSAEMKAKWAALPPDAQAYVAQRESESHKRISELGQQVKAFEPIRNVVEHFRDTFNRTGLAPHDAFARMMAMESRLETDPVGAINDIAAAYGVDLSNGSQAQQEQGSESAEVRSLKAEINALKRQVGETVSKVTARERSEYEQHQASLASLVDEFAKTKTDFADIENDILTQVAAIRQTEPNLTPKETLEKAYEAARWANPKVRDKILADRQKEIDSKAEAERRKSADQAKRVGSINVKSSHASPAKKGNWEQTMREVAERIA